MDWKKDFPLQNRFFETANGILYCCDYKEILSKFPLKVFDLVIADPPYNISRKNNFSTMERYNKYKGMDFGEWDKGFNITGWVDDVSCLLKQDSNFMSFISWQDLGRLSSYCIKKGIKIKRVLIFVKSNPIPVNRDRLFLNACEFGIWGVKGKWIFNRLGKYEKNVFDFVVSRGKTAHPTEKDLKVIKKLICVLSNKDSIVLDIFSGGGTTAEACEMTGRKWIAVEIDRKFCSMIRSRLNKKEKTHDTNSTANEV